MQIEIDRDHMNGDYCVTITREAARPGIDRVTAFWLSPDELTQLSTVLNEEVMDLTA